MEMGRVMREVCFRGKRVANGKWVYGYYKYVKMLDEHIIVGNDDYVSYTIIPETVGQFTGLKDKNGVGIYEGDIVSFLGIRWDGSDGDRVDYVGTVRYSDEYTAFSFEVSEDLQATTFGADDIKVIGNIHDNFDEMLD